MDRRSSPNDLRFDPPVMISVSLAHTDRQCVDQVFTLNEENVTLFLCCFIKYNICDFYISFNNHFSCIAF